MRTKWSWNLLRLLLLFSLLLPSTASAQDVGGYVRTEWRVFGLAGHVSHGPSIAGGVRLLDGVLRIGLTGFARPGPMNPQTFTVAPATGEPYRGQDELTLRSDGAYIGAEVVLDLEVPGVPWLHVLPGVSGGSGAFGFYLTGDDRTTPDGRRVSAWENELQDGRDAGAGFGLELALRLAFVIPGAESIRPTIGGGYYTTIGYDAYARGSYEGPWGSAGVEVVF